MVSRPSTKVRLRSWGFINQPSVGPPGLLRIVFVLSILSTIATLIYAVFTTVSIQGNLYDTSVALIIFALLHFILPMLIAYSIVINNPFSRLLILSYAILISLLYLNQWQLSAVDFGELTVRGPVIATELGLIVYWLYRSRKMKYYFALIKGLPVPDDLAKYGDLLAGDAWLSDRLRSRINWIADHLETIVLVGFIVVVVIAYLVMI